MINIMKRQEQGVVFPGCPLRGVLFKTYNFLPLSYALKISRRAMLLIQGAFLFSGA